MTLLHRSRTHRHLQIEGHQDRLERRPSQRVRRSAYLRDKCPCATCTGAHGTPPREPEAAQAANPFQMFKPALKMLSVEPVGNYAIRIDWSDGHSSGIYSYEHFRQICPCPECRARA